MCKEMKEEFDDQTLSPEEDKKISEALSGAEEQVKEKNENE